MFVARAAKLYLPSGMKLTSSYAAGPNNSYQQITGWVADTTTYPGSTVSSDALVLQSGGSTTLTGSASWSAALSGRGQLQIERNGTVVVTGTAATAGTTGTATATVNITATVGDVITLWWFYSVFTDETITTTTTFVHATQGP